MCGSHARSKRSIFVDVCGSFQPIILGGLREFLYVLDMLVDDGDVLCPSNPYLLQEPSEQSAASEKSQFLNEVSGGQQRGRPGRRS